MDVEKVAYAIRKLRRINATLKPEQFDIGSWVQRTKCGTTACAIGWLLYDDAEAVKYLGVVPTFIDEQKQAALVPAPGGVCAAWTLSGLLDQYGVVATMFGIRKEEAEGLFSMDGYLDLGRMPTLADVLDRFTMFFYMNGGTSEMLLDADQQVQQLVARALCDFEVYEEEPVSGR